MQFCLLGPVEVWDGDERISLGGAKQRALLTLLLLNANRTVRRAQVIGLAVGHPASADRRGPGARVRFSPAPGLASLPNDASGIATADPTIRIRVAGGAGRAGPLRTARRPGAA